MTEPTDRQQQLRDRIVEVEARLRTATDEVEASTKTSIGTADKLEKQRKALHTAEQDHGRTLAQLAEAEREQHQLQGELTTLTRRLEMASLVREARA